MAVGLGARKSNADLKFSYTPPTGADVNLSGGIASGRILQPLQPSGPDSEGSGVHLWVMGITIAAIIYLLGVHWTLASVRAVVD
jgi:hypothetical protein